jgi:serine protease AprX
MAGIIAGSGAMSNGAYPGVAPKANLVSVKVAGWDGSTDVSVVIAGLQWVVANRAHFNIRVLNLSFGTDSKQPYSIDPLNYAVEQTWFSGIFVVVSAGNAGSLPGTITKPGDDPYVLTVGAEDTGATSAKGDDLVAPFSSVGPTQDGLVKPDVVSPGISILSVRDTGSLIDQLHPAAVYGTYYFKGTGTSQAAAIVSGVAALMFQANPTLTPNAAKATLMGTADKSVTAMPGTGAGMVDAAGAVQAAAAKKYALATQTALASTGLGSLEGSRGSAHVYVDLNGDGIPDLLTGEQGYGWSAGAWSAGSWSGQSWSASSWSASAWSASTWSASAWSAGAWSASAWSASAWSASAWSGSAWSAGAWSGSAWSAGAWSGASWSASAWSSSGWSSSAWSDLTWS